MSALNSNERQNHSDEAVGFDMVGNIYSNMQHQQQTEQDDIDAFMARMSRKRKRPRGGNKQSKIKLASIDNVMDVNDTNDTSDSNDGDRHIVINSMGYTSLLDRLFDQLNGENNNNNNNNSGNSKNNQEKARSFVIPKPLCYRDGSKKTYWSNFNHTCKQLRREISHVQKFILTELNTSGNLDGNKNLSLRGKWTSEKIQKILRDYIKKYVECINCHSLNTTVAKSREIKKLKILTCESCHATRAVDAIQGGYHHFDKGARRKLRNAN